MSKTNKVETKICTRCPPDDNIKPISEFYVCKGGYIRSSCKKCDNAMTKAYKAKSKKHISSYNKKYKKEHCDEISVYNHNYNKNNREAIQKRQTKTRRIRKETDPNFKITTDLRCKLNAFIKFKGRCYKDEIPDLIGCDYDSLMAWFVYLFDDEMTIENYGDYWSVDHVNPCCNFDLTYEENQCICFNWSNLRPMKKLDNSKKVGKTIDNEIDKQNEHKNFFMKYMKKEDKKDCYDVC
jgi:hypothetical protein